MFSVDIIKFSEKDAQFYWVIYKKKMPQRKECRISTFGLCYDIQWKSKLAKITEQEDNRQNVFTVVEQVRSVLHYEVIPMLYKCNSQLIYQIKYWGI